MGQITRFIVEIVGKDALIYFKLLDESTLKDAYREQGSYEKYKVKAQDYSFQFTYENSVFGQIYQFFVRLEKEFYMTEIHKDFYMDGLITSLLCQVAGMRCFEVKQADIANKLVFTQVFEFIDYIEHGSSLDFDSLLCGFCTNRSLSFEEFYRKTAGIAGMDEGSVKRAVQRCRKEHILPKWEIFYSILKVVSESDDAEKTVTNDFLHLYFYCNFRAATEYISVDKNLFDEFESLAKNFSETGYKNFYDKYLDENKTGLHELKNYFTYFDFLCKENTIENVQRFQTDFNRLTSELPHSIVFWQDWFCAKYCVFKYMESGDVAELGNAVELYTAAFNDGKYFAGKSLEQFLLEAIAVSFYYDWKSDPKQMRDRIWKASAISNTGTKTPLSAHTKLFYDFAYAFDFVLNEKEGAFNYFYHCNENFWIVFPPQTEKSKAIYGKDYLEAMGFQITEKSIESKNEEMRNHLSSTTDNAINKRVETERKVAYTPLSQAICNCEWDIVRNFLDTNKYPNLDLNIPNTNNTCPILELLTKYKSDVFSSVCGDPRYLNKKLPESEDERVRLFTEVLDRTDKRTLFTQSNHRKISVLQEALETFDMRYIKPIVDKMTDGGKRKFPDDFHISADELSPLYYAVELKFRLNTDPRKEFKKMLESQNIRWDNFAVPGMTEEEKKSYWNSIRNGSSNFGKFSQIFTEEMIQKRTEAIRKAKQDGSFSRCVSQIDEAISLLIDRTADVDAFIAYTGEFQKKQFFQTLYSTDYGTVRTKKPEKFRQGVTALGYAGEADDKETCRKLIPVGADVTRQPGIASEKFGPVEIHFPNSFVYRLIFYKSWKTLRMFLTEFREKASQVMHRDGECNMTPLVYFILRRPIDFQQDRELNRKPMDLAEIEDFIRLFRDAGASMTEQTSVGSAESLMQRSFSAL